MLREACIGQDLFHAVRPEVCCLGAPAVRLGNPAPFAFAREVVARLLYTLLERPKWDELCPRLVVSLERRGVLAEHSRARETHLERARLYLKPSACGSHLQV